MYIVLWMDSSWRRIGHFNRRSLPWNRSTPATCPQIVLQIKFRDMKYELWFCSNLLHYITLQFWSGVLIESNVEFVWNKLTKHLHRKNVTSYHFHILTHQSHISQVFFWYPHSPESHQSSLQKVSSLTRVTSVKSLEGILTHQSHISKVFCRYHHHSPGSHQSSL